MSLESAEWCQKLLELSGSMADVPMLVNCKLKPTSSRTYSTQVGHWEMKDYDLVELTELEKEYLKCTILCFDNV